MIFAFGLIMVEAIIVVSLIASYIWVERDLCPAEFYASGHCYAQWFTWFDWLFYCLAFILFYSSAGLLIIRFFQPIQGGIIKGVSWLLTLLLLVFTFISELHLIGQSLISIAFVHSFKLYALSKYTIYNYSVK